MNIASYNLYCHLPTLRKVLYSCWPAARGRDSSLCLHIPEESTWTRGVCERIYVPSAALSKYLLTCRLIYTTDKYAHIQILHSDTMYPMSIYTFSGLGSCLFAVKRITLLSHFETGNDSYLISNINNNNNNRLRIHKI